MNVWVRVVPSVESEEHGPRVHDRSRIEVHAALSLTVYPTRELAEKEQVAFGGIILEVNAACLRGQHWDGNNEVYLLLDGSDDKFSGCANITVCYADLPHTMVPNYGGYEPGTVMAQGDIAEFGTEAKKFFEEFEKETGFELHQ